MRKTKNIDHIVLGTMQQLMYTEIPHSLHRRGINFPKIVQVGGFKIFCWKMGQKYQWGLYSLKWKDR